ncbi:MAG TPA: GNAT family N-acetyltransferase [Candidatus Paceibacterota bacterium]|nr:GNAT family N-acetyltransferase [Candidatus Paceibacterota bacterium]
MNIDTLKISPLTPADVPEIQDLLYRSWLATYPNKGAGITEDDINDWFSGKNSKEGIARTIKSVENKHENFNALVAKIDNKAVGFCAMGKHLDYNRLAMLYILPGYFGQGIGRSMWAAIQYYADSSKPTILEVVLYNVRAIKFYESLGFVDTGKRITDQKNRMKSGAIPPEMVMRREPTMVL